MVGNFGGYIYVDFVECVGVCYVSDCDGFGMVVCFVVICGC